MAPQSLRRTRGDSEEVAIGSEPGPQAHVRETEIDGEPLRIGLTTV